MSHSPGPMKSLPSAAIEALQRRHKIEAIKAVRADRNLGLKESKDLVDSYLRTQPVLQRQIEAAQTEARFALLGWLVVILVILAAGISLWLH